MLILARVLFYSLDVVFFQKHLQRLNNELIHKTFYQITEDSSTKISDWFSLKMCLQIKFQEELFVT